MTNFGLLLMALIQFGTAAAMYFSVNLSHIYGIRTLTRDLSVYRYLLTALWLSVGLLPNRCLQPNHRPRRGPARVFQCRH